MKSLLLLAALLGAGLAEEPVSYEGYKVYTVESATEEQSELLMTFRDNPLYDFWTPVRLASKTDIMVSPLEQEIFESFLTYHDFEYSIRINNVQDTIEAERMTQRLIEDVPEGKISFTKYHRYADILAYVRQLASQYPNLVSVETIGKSTENRDLVMVKISSGGSGKPAILIDGAIHAREWIAPAMVLYIIQELVENSSNSALIKDVDWYILPVINPDGYEYSHVTNRLWRKTRSRGSRCYGVDGNRNFDFHWGEVGASSDECSETYKGPTAFSEPETRALRDYVNKNRNKFKLYLTFHSYGQYLLYPWGYTSALPTNARELQSLGESVDRAIQAVAGTKYKVGSSTNVLYAAAGGSDDWVMGVGGVSLPYTVELPGGGTSGFDLPPSRILPVAKETFEGVKVFYNYVRNL